MASVKKSAAGAVPATLLTTPQSQVPSTSLDIRHLFSGLPASLVTAPAYEAFVPTFRTATVTDGVNVWGLNHNYFATKDTAQWIANKYGTGQVIETPFEGSGGPFAASANEYHIKISGWRMVNAGILAGYYERNPSQFPGLADADRCHSGWVDFQNLVAAPQRPKTQGYFWRSWRPWLFIFYCTAYSHAC